MTNFILPDFIGLGNGITRGYGSIKHEKKIKDEEAKKLFPDGWNAVKPYLRKVPDPTK